MLETYASEKTDDGRARLVRHGHLPEREVMTGVGAVPVKVPRVRDRGDDAEKVRFTSTILPPYLRKAKSIEDLPPCLGPMLQDCPQPRYRASKPIGGMSMTAGRDLSTRRFVYVWAPLVHASHTLPGNGRCLLSPANG